MLNKPQWKIIKTRLSEVSEVLRRINPITRQRVLNACRFVRKSWKSIAIILPLFLLLYYIVGSWATNNIDKTLVTNMEKSSAGLTVVDSAAALIKREVDDNMWTPSLPFIFPGYVLDNMPQYQLGIVQSLRTVVRELSRCYDSENLNKAAELLDYPGNVWLLSKTENLSLAPSSGAQYRRARKALLRFNEKPLLPKTSQDEILTGVLRDIANNMDAVMADIERHVREHSSDWVDNSADNVFYYNQGRLYGYYVVLKALAEDFEPLILAADQYEHWTALVKSLESGVQLDPFVVRNGMPDSGSAPNHLLALGYYAAKADLQLNKIILNLQEKDNAH